MPRSTALTHFWTATSLEPYQRTFRLLTKQVEGMPPSMPGLVLVVYLVNIHLITRPHRSELRGNRALALFRRQRTRMESALLLYSAAVRR
jgi:hypothetical protein